VNSKSPEFDLAGEKRGLRGVGRMKRYELSIKVSVTRVVRACWKSEKKRVLEREGSGDWV